MRATLFFIAFTINILANAQPGYIDISQNIDDLTKKEANLNKQNPTFYLLTVVIDSTSSDFYKLNFLKNHKQLVFNIQTPTFPKAFNEIVFDSIQKVAFYCNNVVYNIENLKGFEKAVELQFFNYAGKKLPSILTDFDNLEFLNLGTAQNLKNVRVLPRIKKLRRLILNCSNLKTFPQFKKGNNLKGLELTDLNQNFNLTKLKTLDNLFNIKFDIAAKLREIPSYLSKSLVNLSVNGNIHSISNLNLYPNLRHISIINTQLKSFDVNLENNINLINIHLKRNKKMAEIKGIYTCKNLEYLLISGLPLLKKFHFKNLNLKQGLTIQNSGIIKIEPMEKLYELEYLYLTHNDYLNINIDPIKRKWTVWNNGKKLEKNNK